MKHLKLYNEIKLLENFSTDDVKDVFEPYINWKLIFDIEDLSLDYLDNGLELNIWVYYYDPDVKDHFYIVYEVYYSHESENRRFSDSVFNNLTEGPYELEPIKEDKIYYQLNLTKYGDNKMHIRNELVERIRDIYPNENILN